MGNKQGGEKRPSQISRGGGSTLGQKKRESELSIQRKTSSQQAEDLSVYQKKPDRKLSSSSQVSQVSVQRKTSSQQAEDLAMYQKKADRKLSSSSQLSQTNYENQDIPQGEVSKPIEEDNPPQRQMLFDHLVAFYFRNDNERLLSNEVDVEGIVNWAYSGGESGIAALNEKLKEKYGED